MSDSKKPLRPKESRLLAIDFLKVGSGKQSKIESRTNKKKKKKEEEEERKNGTK